MNKVEDIYKRITRRLPAELVADLPKLTVLFIIWVCVILSVAYFASNELYGIRDYQTKEIVDGNKLQKVEPPEILEGLMRWDGPWYVDIALNGYHKPHPTDTPGFETNRQVAFFPLYPTLIRAGLKVGLNPAVAAIGINILLSFGCLLFIYLIALEQLKSRKLALRTSILFLFLPASFFLISPYTEAVFCFFSFGAFYFAMKQRWLTANIFLAFCTASRSAGLIVALCIFLYYLHSHNWRWRSIDRSVLFFFIAPLGTILYALYLWHTFNNPLLMLDAQKYWAQSIQPNILLTLWDKTVDIVAAIATPGYDSFGGDYGKEWINLMTWGSFVSAGVICLWAYLRKNLSLPLALYVVISLIFFISKGNFISVNRYTLPLFPVYLLLVFYTRKSEFWFTILLAISSIIMCFTLIQFSISYWAG